MRKKLFIVLPMLIILLLASVGVVDASQGLTVNRLAGYDRYETAFQIAKTGWQQSDYAVIADGGNYPDALAAVPLAAKLNAPLLLTNTNSLNPKTSTALKDLKVMKIYLVGGTAVISSDVENQLTKAGYIVKRIAGQDKYATAIKIAEELGDAKEVAVTVGDDYADALSIGPIAAKRQMPIILVPKNNITSDIENYVNSKNITKTYVIGDQSLISDNVVKKFNNPERILGQDKYARNIAVLNRFTESYQHSNLCLATGENFADALAGAVYAAKNNGAVTLVKSDLPVSTDAFLKGNTTALTTITVFGGEAVVPSKLVQEVFKNAIEKLDFGTVNGQTYTNNYFGLKVIIPDEWIVANNVKLTQALSNNQDLEISNPFDASCYNDVELLLTNQDYFEAEENQAFQLEATKIDSTFANSDEYLAIGKKELDNSPLKFTYPKEIYTKKLNDLDFKVLEFQIKLSDSMTVKTKVYTTILKGYALSFVLTYANTDSSDLDQMLSSVQFSK